MSDRVEFWLDNKLLCMVHSSMVPEKGAYINIRKETFKARHVSFCVDYADDARACYLRCNVELTRSKAKP